MNSFFKKLTISFFESPVFIFKTWVINRREKDQFLNNIFLIFLPLVLVVGGGLVWFMFLTMTPAILSTMGTFIIMAVMMLLVGEVTSNQGPGVVAALIAALASLLLGFFSSIISFPFILFFLFSSKEKKKEIQLEVGAFYKQKRIEERRKKFEQADNIKTKQESILTTTKLLTYLESLENPALKSFIKERMNPYAGENTNNFLLFVALTLPLKRLSLDGAKQILQNCVNLTVSKGYIEKNMVLRKEFFTNPEVLESLWGNLTERQIKRLLTSFFTTDDYLKFVKAFDNDKPLDYGAKSLNKIIQAEKKPISNDLVLNIKSTNDQYFFVIPKDTHDFKKTREDFKNCIESYAKREDVDIICLYSSKDSSPVSCVSVDKLLNVVEMKAPFNRSVDASVASVIKDSLKSLKSAS